MNKLDGLSLEDVSNGHRNKVAAAYVMKHVKSLKVYVGSSGHIVKRHFRHWQDLRAGKHQNKHLQELYNDSPDFKIVYYLADDKQHALSLEQTLMDTFRKSGNLINIYLDVTHPNKGMSLSEETKKKISLANIGKKLSAETKKKIGDMHRGKKRSPEFKEFLSQRLKGIPKSLDKREAFIKDRQAKFGNVILVDDHEYPSLNEAAKQFGLSASSVKHRLLSDKYPSWNYKVPSD